MYTIRTMYWSNFETRVIQKASTKKQEASIEGLSVYKVGVEDGGSVFWKRGNASIASLSCRPTRVQQVFRRTRRERERDLLCKCPICTGCVHVSLILNHLPEPRFFELCLSLELNFHFQPCLVFLKIFQAIF